MKTKKIENFKDDKLSKTGAGNVTGGLGGGSTATCRNLEEQHSDAIGRGDFEEASRIMRIILRVCGFPGQF